MWVKQPALNVPLSLSLCRKVKRHIKKIKKPTIGHSSKHGEGYQENKKTEEGGKKKQAPPGKPLWKQATLESC